MLDRWVCQRAGLDSAEDRRALETRQLERINETVQWARAHSSFYRERLPAGEIVSWEDFLCLPLMTSDDLRNSGRRMLCVSPQEVTRVVTLTTSGTAGAPKRICFTAAEQENTVEYFQHGMAEFVYPGERVMSLFPGRSPDSLNDLLFRALARLGTEPVWFGFPVSERRKEEMLYEILAGGIDFLVGPPEAIAAAARLSRKSGLAPKIARQVRGVLLASEYVSPENYAEIRQTWMCEVNEHYSMTETGFAGAVGCTEPGGYHVWESDLYYEIIDPVTGARKPDGERGEIVVTTLSRKAMPFIRYRTGDFSRFLPGDCPCGSRLRRLARVERRAQKKVFAERSQPVSLFDW